jgi:hypothetical protein
MNNLIIPNKEKLLDFIHKNIDKSNYNIGIVGTIGTGKTIICEYIIDNFISKQPEKYRSHNKQKHIIYRWNCFDDVNLLEEFNNLDTFCKNNTGCQKLIYFENFDDLSDSYQQNLKIYIDKYSIFKENNKIFFLIKTSDKTSIRDILRTRLEIYEQLPTTSQEHLHIIRYFQKLKNIDITDEASSKILNIRNIGYHNIKHTFEKADIMGIEVIDNDNILSLTTIIDNKVFDEYISNIQKSKFRDSVRLLDNLFVDGYDIGDIYFFFYEYIKSKLSTNEISPHIYYQIIEILCFYINEMYNGFYDRFVLVLFTFDVFNKVNEMHHNELCLN